MGEVENACFDRSLTKAVQQNKSRICITST
jgi:hypothetical protein